MFNAPQPRSRLYTSVGSYAKGLPPALLGIGYDNGGVGELEQELRSVAPEREIVAVPMARVGIYLLLKHLIRKGQKVILSPYTISDVVNMVLCAGGVPLFADIEEGGSCNIDANAVRELLETEDDIGAVLVTHFYGLMCNLRPILDACQAKGIPVIEDAAQAFGARYEGKPAGTIADAGVFSFGLLKNVTGFLGGAVSSRIKSSPMQFAGSWRGFHSRRVSRCSRKCIQGRVFDLATFPPVFDAASIGCFATPTSTTSTFSTTNSRRTQSVAYRYFPSAMPTDVRRPGGDHRAQLRRSEAQTQRAHRQGGVL